jgi:hypothetical protein
MKNEWNRLLVIGDNDHNAHGNADGNVSSRRWHVLCGDDLSSYQYVILLL